MGSHFLNQLESPFFMIFNYHTFRRVVTAKKKKKLAPSSLPPPPFILSLKDYVYIGISAFKTVYSRHQQHLPVL